LTHCLQRSPDSLAVFKGAYFSGQGEGRREEGADGKEAGKGRKMEEEEEEGGRGRREGDGPGP